MSHKPLGMTSDQCVATGASSCFHQRLELMSCEIGQYLYSVVRLISASGQRVARHLLGDHARRDLEMG